MLLAASPSHRHPFSAIYDVPNATYTALVEASLDVTFSANAALSVFHVGSYL